MRLTLTIIALLCAGLAFAAGDEQAEQAEQTQRYEVAIDGAELADGIDGIADVLEKHLSGPAGLYYAATLRRMRVCNGLQAAGAAAALVALLCGATFCWHKSTNVACGGDDAGYVAGLIISLLAAVFAIGMVTVGIIGYLTADYLAMQQIIDTAASFTH